MTVDSTCYRFSGGSWKNGVQGNGNLGSNARNHGEQKAYAAQNRQNSTVFLIVQNAFPCAECHQHFRQRTNGTGMSVIIRVTANHGSYATDHPVDHRAPPKSIYYHNGAATYGVAPAGFPAHSNATVYG